MSKEKSAAVIGAGIVGLVTMKQLKDEGFNITCFEQTGHIGGLWRYHEDDTDGVASVMKTTVINNSKEMGALSDFPPPAAFPNYMHNSMMYEYIRMYMERFDGMKYIKFHQKTIKIEKADDYEETGRWRIISKNTQTDEIVSDVFDCVAICIGHHVHPNIPTFPGQEEFRGKIIHSHSLKKAQGFDDMRIVVVGTGNSGMDAAVELSSVAKQVYLSTRRGMWVMPKVMPSGRPLDASVLRRSLQLPVRFLPTNLLFKFSEMYINSLHDHDFYNLKPKHSVLSQHPTMSDTIFTKLLSGVVTVRGDIKKFTSNGVIFEGEKNETQVDAVILCTGYRVKFSFLNEDILPVRDNWVKLYKYIFPPDLPHPTLAVIGLIQTNGPGIPAGEMQCRWASRVMSGRLALPPKEKMYAAIKEQDEFNRRWFVDSPRHTFEVDSIRYQDELAEEIGAKPNLLKMAITDPKLFWAVFNGPFLPYQYRLQGPHAWDGARDAILTYEKRLRAPLQKPGQEMKKEFRMPHFETICLLCLLSLICYLLLRTFTTYI